MNRALLLAFAIGAASMLVLGVWLTRWLVSASAPATPERAAVGPVATPVATPAPVSRGAATLDVEDGDQGQDGEQGEDGEPAPEAAGSPSPGPSPEPGVATPPAASPTPDELRRARIGNTDGQGANLRREPNPGSQRVVVIRDGTEVDVVGPDREVNGRPWRNVQDSNGNTGWVPAEFLLDDRAVGPRPTPTPVPPSIEVVDYTSPVGRDEEAELQIKTRPGLRCEVQLLLYGPGTVPTLESKVADAEGLCSWTWTVPPSVVPGTWRYRVRVGTGEDRITREVTFRVT